MLDDALRITLGTPAENDRVLQVLNGLGDSCLERSVVATAEQPA